MTPLRALLLACALGAIVVLAGASPAAPDPTPQQTIAKQKQTIRALRANRDDLRQERDAQDAVIGDQNTQITRLQFRLANPPDPLDVIAARNPDGLWAAAQAIWREFPTLAVGSLCGFDKASTQSAELTPDSLTFYRWTGC